MIISILNKEKQIQIKDLTRFDASKSVLVKGTVNPITFVKLKIGADGAFIDVFNASSKNWFLDYAFSSYKFDVDSTNSKLIFEANNTPYSIDVVAGTYTLSTLLVAIKSIIELSVPLFTVDFSLDDKNKITITSSGTIKIKPKASASCLLQHLGFKDEGQLISYPVEYGLRKIVLEVGSITESNIVEEYVEVYSVEGDALFSEDSDLIIFENDIMKWTPAGHGSFIYLHRKAQRNIIDWMDRQGYRDDFNNKLTKFAFVDNSDVRMWATYNALKMLFMSFNNSTDDVFKKKSEYYSALEIEARSRAVLSLDLDGDSQKDVSSTPDIQSGRLFFR